MGVSLVLLARRRSTNHGGEGQVCGLATNLLYSLLSLAMRFLQEYTFFFSYFSRLEKYESALWTRAAILAVFFARYELDKPEE